MHRTGQNVLREARRIGQGEEIESLAHDSLRTISMGLLRASMDELQDEWGTVTWRWDDTYHRGEPEWMMVEAHFDSRLGDDHHDGLFHVRHMLDLGKRHVAIEVYLEKIHDRMAPRVAKRTRKAEVPTSAKVSQVADATREIFASFVGDLVRED